MRSLGDRDPLPKKIHKNTKLDLVTAGQAWDSCQRLWISKPILNYTLKTTDKSPGHFPASSTVTFVLRNAKENSNAFSESFFWLRQSETLPNEQRTPGTAHGTIRKHVCRVSSSAPAARCLSHVPISVSHHLFFVRCKLKQMPGPPGCGQM